MDVAAGVLSGLQLLRSECVITLTLLSFFDPIFKCDLKCLFPTMSVAFVKFSERSKIILCHSRKMLF